jgi:hypothetical protein
MVRNNRRRSAGAARLRLRARHDRFRFRDRILHDRQRAAPILREALDALYRLKQLIR